MDMQNLAADLVCQKSVDQDDNDGDDDDDDDHDHVGDDGDDDDDYKWWKAGRRRCLSSVNLIQLTGQLIKPT